MKKNSIKLTEEDEGAALERLLVIDEEHLLKEWKENSLLLIQAVRLFARTQAASSEAEIEIKKAEGKAFIKAKTEGIKDIAKPSDEVSKHAVASDPEIVAMKLAKVAIDHRLNILKGLVKSFEQRAMALKYVQLNAGLPGVDSGFAWGIKEHTLKNELDAD